MTETPPLRNGSGAGRECVLRHADGVSRKVYVREHEIPYPEGKLIVSRTDPGGRITHANRAFVEMSGYDEHELLGAPHYVLRHPDMPAAAFKALWDTVGRREPWRGYVKNLRKDGSCYWVFATVIANVRDGEVVGYTSVRRKPSRAQVEACATLYARMRMEEGTNLAAENGSR